MNNRKKKYYKTENYKFYFIFKIKKKYIHKNKFKSIIII